jgi:flagellar protein FlgJ
MIGGADLSAKFALDVQGVGALRLEARQNSPEALKAAARQFEAVFMNMLMKSMRDASPQDGLFDSEQTRMYTSMLDQQLSQNLASRGIGMADVMVRQLSGAAYQAPVAAPAAGTAAPSGLPLDAPSGLPLTVPQAPADAPVAGAARALGGVPALPSSPPAARDGATPAHVEAFVQRLLPHAREASAGSGIPAAFMLGQAALETGWGRSEIRAADGRNSHNLFGIKAGGSWKGDTVDIVTTEYVNGKPQKQVDSFRAYDSYADAFRDYAALLRGNARYRNAVAGGQDAAGFARGLQQGGYATDPNYAQKLMSVIRRIDTA